MTNLPMPTVAERIVAAWNSLATRYNPYAAIAVACALLAGPLIFFRGYNSDEGLAVTIARTAVEDGEWLVPHVFNMRWIERPTLLSWIIAAISEPFGGVSQITARLPIALFLLFGCVLIYLLLRKVAASVPAALFGVALFLACPLVIRSYVMITADLPLAVLLFFAFYLWWTRQPGRTDRAWPLARDRRCAGACGLVQGTAADCVFRAWRRPLCSRLACVAANSRTGPGRRHLRAPPRRLVRRHLCARRRADLGHLYARAPGHHFFRSGRGIRPLAGGHVSGGAGGGGVSDCARL